MSRRTSNQFSRVLATNKQSKLFDENNNLKKGVTPVGIVTGNHGSTIVQSHVSRSGKTYYTYGGSTHQLTHKTQAALAYQLDQKNCDKSYLYEIKKPAYSKSTKFIDYSGDKYDKK